MLAKIPSSMDISRAMSRGALAGLELALEQVAEKAARHAPYADEPASATASQHLRDGVRIIGPVSSGNDDLHAQVAFQVHSLHPSNEGFSYARARHQGFYYVTASGERNYESRGKRFPRTGVFQYKHATDPEAEHRFLFHAARTTRFQVRNTIAGAIFTSLGASL